MTAERGDRPEPRTLLHRLEPFVVAPRWRFDRLDLAPLGAPVIPANRFDVLSAATERFLTRLVRLDRLTFGSVGMPMPGWLFVDASALPGVIAGLGVRSRALAADTLSRLGFDAGADELIPLSMFIAVPVRPPDVWYAHNLASLNRQVPELHLRGLAGVTKAMGLRVMGCTEQIGATQWASAALRVHTHFGPLELLTAWTPAHANPATLTYRLRLTDAGIADVLRGRRSRRSNADVLWVSVRDIDALHDLEHRIEFGARFAIVGPPVREPDGSTRVPVAELSPRP